MQDTPPPPSPRTPVLRLAAGVAIAGLGAILLIAGLGLLLVSGTSAPEPSSAVATTSVAGGAAPSIPATGTPTLLDSSSTPGGSTPGAPSSSGGTLQSARPSSSADPVLVGAGDIGRCDGTADDDTAALVERMPGIVFTLGDNAYDNGSAAEFRDCYGRSWGRFLDRTLLPVPGNHDYGTPDAAGYKSYFGDLAVTDGATWSSRDIGSWHVIVLDGDCGELKGGCRPDSRQVRWLRDDLAASGARCTLALWHQPRFSSGDDHGNDATVAPFWDALYAAGADLVLNGHDHDYERFVPQTPEGEADPARGITEMVVGTGGAPLRGFGKAAANTVVRSNLAHGVIELTLRPSGWDYRFVSTDGTFSDQGSGRCH